MSMMNKKCEVEPSCHPKKAFCLNFVWLGVHGASEKTGVEASCHPISFYIWHKA